MASQPLRGNARVLVASMVGTTVEYYDFYLYGYAAALVFGPLFFPARSPAAQTLFALMSFGIAFFARPIGAVAFGHFGDRIGRKATLVASLLLMGSCTLAIAFLPTYAMVGWIATVLLCVLRFGQGFGLGGEWAGAALLSIENAPMGWDARFAAMAPLGSIFGNIAATTMFVLMTSVLSDADFRSWGWRLPFLASAVLVAFGLWVRLKISETKEFRKTVAREAPPRVPIAQLFAEYPMAVVAGAAAIPCSFALVYLAGPFALSQATSKLGYDRNTFLIAQLFALFCGIPVLILSAILADRIGPAKVFASSAFAAVPVGFLFGPGLNSDSMPLVTLTLIATGCCWGLMNAALTAWLSRLYPCRIRYSGFAFTFNTGGIIGGAIVPIIAQMMSAAGALDYVGLLLSVAGLVAFVAVKLSRPAQGAGPMDEAQGALVAG